MKKASMQTVKANNKGLVLSCLHGGAVSRAEIVKRTGLSKAAVTLIVNDCIEKGELVECGINASGSVGRPTVDIDIVPDYRYAVGFSIQRSTASVCVTDLKSNPIDVITAPMDNFTAAHDMMDWLVEGMEKILKENRIPMEKIIGIGISCPGPLDYRSGVVLNPPNLSLLHYFPVKDYLKSRTGLPVFLDNIAIALAISETGAGNDGFRNCMFIVSIDGIGSATILDGQVYRGSNGFSGELGHICVGGDAVCDCGNTGCLERYITVKALRDRFGFGDYEDIVVGKMKGDAKAEEIFEFAVQKLSQAVVSAVNLMDLDAVILFGDLNDSKGLMVKRLREEIARRSMIASAHPVAVRGSRLNDDSNITCSTAAIIKAYFEQRISD